MKYYVVILISFFAFSQEEVDYKLSSCKYYSKNSFDLDCFKYLLKKDKKLHADLIINYVDIHNRFEYTELAFNHYLALFTGKEKKHTKSDYIKLMEEEKDLLILYLQQGVLAKDKFSINKAKELSKMDKYFKEKLK